MVYKKGDYWKIVGSAVKYTEEPVELDEYVELEEFLEWKSAEET